MERLALAIHAPEGIMDPRRPAHLWTGEPAVRIAKFKIAVGVLLGMLGVGSSVILWSLGDTMVDQTANAAYANGHEVHATDWLETADRDSGKAYAPPISELMSRAINHSPSG